MSTQKHQKNGSDVKKSDKDLEFGDLLAKYIDDLDVSATKFGEKIKTSGQTISNWINKDNEPGPLYSRRLREVYGIQVHPPEFPSPPFMPDDNGANEGERSLNELEDRPSGATDRTHQSAPIYTMPISPKEGRLLEAVNQIGTISVQTSGVLFVYLHSCVEMRPTLPQGICIPIRPVSGGLDAIVASGIYVYRYGSQYQVRRLVYTGRGIYQALASNPDYPPLELSADTLDKDFELLGIIDLNL